MYLSYIFMRRITPFSADFNFIKQLDYQVLGMSLFHGMGSSSDTSAGRGKKSEGKKVKGRNALMLDQVLSCEGMGGSGYIDPDFLGLGTSWK
jgi:hypothetical protein